MRHPKAVLDLRWELSALPGLANVAGDVLDRTAEAYVATALRDGFALGTGVPRVGLRAASFGIGFLHDHQYPQLTALFRDDIRGDEARRLYLLAQWAVYAMHRAGVFSPDATIARLQKLAAFLHEYGARAFSGDVSALFHAIDPAKHALHSAHVWRGIAAAWRVFFGQVIAQDAQATVDFACALAFCCGQHFSHDPLWDRLADLRLTTLSAFVE